REKREAGSGPPSTRPVNTVAGLRHRSSQSSEIPLALARGRKGGANGVGRAFGVSCFVRTHETPGFSRGEKSSQHEPKETAMPAGTRRAIAMFTDFFAAADLEATARRTGFVQRTAKITGTLLLALVPVGTGREGQTTLAHLAAKGTPWCQPGAVSPEAMPQRMHQKALAFLQDM